MLDTNLITYLRAQATSAGNRVHTGNAPQDTALPVVIIRRVSGTTPRVLGGTSLFSRATFTVDCIGRDYADALPLANDIRVILDNYRGELVDTKVMSARCLAEPADYSEIDGDLILRRISQDFLFVYRDS